MPPGLRNTIQTFHRHMDNIFRDLPFVAVYIDDLIVMSDSLEEHIVHLEAVFQKLRAHRLVINVDKCDFAKKELTYLGVRVTPAGFSLHPGSKPSCLLKKPNTIVELRRFLGMTNYYRCCLPNAAQLQVPLNQFLQGAKKRDKRAVPWTPEAEQAFDRCRSAIVAATQNTFMSASAPLHLTTDASEVAIGAALEQYDADCILI